MSNQIKVIEELDNQVLSVIGSDKLLGFQKAYAVATATGELKRLLTNEYMNPIMNLQGNKLGFKTDRDSSGGYPLDVVKNCLIEAVLMGVQPVGNQFNIIAGNSYITKEGFGYMLSNMKGLWYEIIPQLPRISKDMSSAAITMRVSWSLNGSEKTIREIDIPIKMNKMMGTDAVIGKATRKARAWLYNTVTGCEITDGDVTDGDFRLIPSTPTTEERNKAEETARVVKFLEKVKSIDDLDILEDSLYGEEITEEAQQAIDAKREALTAKP